MTKTTNNTNDVSAEEFYKNYYHMDQQGGLANDQIESIDCMETFAASRLAAVSEDNLQSDLIADNYKWENEKLKKELAEAEDRINHVNCSLLNMKNQRDDAIRNLAQEQERSEKFVDLLKLMIYDSEINISEIEKEINEIKEKNE